jgi:hypothetical protein
VRQRISEELSLLRETFGDVDHEEADGNDWFRIARYSFPSGWSQGDEPITEAEVIFNANASYPTGDPYSFWTPPNLKFNAQAPNNATEVETTPFGGKRLQFSWAPDGTWAPGLTVKGGSNLADWARSFTKRLMEGV